MSGVQGPGDRADELDLAAVAWRLRTTLAGAADIEVGGGDDVLATIRHRSRRRRRAKRTMGASLAAFAVTVTSLILIAGTRAAPESDQLARGSDHPAVTPGGGDAQSSRTARDGSTTGERPGGEPAAPGQVESGDCTVSDQEPGGACASGSPLPENGPDPSARRAEGCGEPGTPCPATGPATPAPTGAPPGESGGPTTAAGAGPSRLGDQIVTFRAGPIEPGSSSPGPLIDCARVPAGTNPLDCLREAMDDKQPAVLEMETTFRSPPPDQPGQTDPPDQQATRTKIAVEPGRGFQVTTVEPATGKITEQLCKELQDERSPAYDARSPCEPAGGSGPARPAESG